MYVMISHDNLTVIATNLFIFIYLLPLFVPEEQIVITYKQANNIKIYVV